MSYTCFTCNSIIDSCINYNSNYYCSKECYISILKKCEFCFKEFNMIKTPSFYNEPYFFCSIKHMNLANPRIRFGVIGGPIGGHLGKPAIIIECDEPQMSSNPQYIAPAPEKPKMAPPGLQRQLNALPMPLNANQCLRSMYGLPPPIINVPVFRPYIYPNFSHKMFY
jgi:hypothetical protein